MWSTKFRKCMVTRAMLSRRSRDREKKRCSPLSLRFIAHICCLDSCSESLLKFLVQICGSDCSDWLPRFVAQIRCLYVLAHIHYYSLLRIVSEWFAFRFSDRRFTAQNIFIFRFIFRFRSILKFRSRFRAMQFQIRFKFRSIFRFRSNSYPYSNSDPCSYE